MASCLKCSGFGERFNIPDIREYRDIVRQLVEIVSQGTFLLVYASCQLQDTLKDPLPGDIILHKFKCFGCGRIFQLQADTYHGHARWTVEDGPQTSGGLLKPN